MVFAEDVLSDEESYIQFNFNPANADIQFGTEDCYLYDFDLFYAILNGKVIDLENNMDFINIDVKD